MEPVVNLDADETAHAERLGDVRHREALRAKLSGKHGGPTSGPKSVEVHRAGAVGECVVAKYLSLPMPTTVNTFKSPDLSRAVQVRTRRKPEYELIVRADDSIYEAFVLVTYVSRSSGIVRGFIVGHQAKDRRWLRTHGNREAAYFVPNRLLVPPEILPRWIESGSIAPLDSEIQW